MEKYIIMYIGIVNRNDMQDQIIIAEQTKIRVIVTSN